MVEGGVLALGAWLKNRACLLLPGPRAQWSARHGDLSDGTACAALEKSARELVAQCGLPQAIAHDLHLDFFSTHLACNLSRQWGIPAIGVQHHHAHIAGVMAEHGLKEPVIGLALDGVGLGLDGAAWGGELLFVDASGFARLGHLWPLAMPGGDVAAREPWRMLAAALHAMGRGSEIGERLAAMAGADGVRIIHGMLERGLLSPFTTSAGRWFDAAAAALGLAPRQQTEAEAAIALEQLATSYTGSIAEDREVPTITDSGVLDLRPLIAALLLDGRSGPRHASAAAAWFHRTLADALAEWAAQAAERTGSQTVALSGGCFLNQLLKRRVKQQLTQRGLWVIHPEAHSCGDAGIALGQAWAAQRQLGLAPVHKHSAEEKETPPCV